MRPLVNHGGVSMHGRMERKGSKISLNNDPVVLISWVEKWEQKAGAESESKSESESTSTIGSLHDTQVINTFLGALAVK